MVACLRALPLLFFSVSISHPTSLISPFDLLLFKYKYKQKTVGLVQIARGQHESEWIRLDYDHQCICVLATVHIDLFQCRKLSQ